MNLLITGGRVIDPRNGRDEIADVLVSNGKIAGVEKNISQKENVTKISAHGAWVLPGLIDVHVHLREPGGEESETIETGSAAAAAGGVTSVVAMANTRPPIDSPQQVRYVLRRAKEKALVRVYPVGSVTKNLEGRELTDIPALVKEGCVALSDDGRCIMDSRLMRRALENTRGFGVPLIDHCEDENLSLGGVMNEGSLSIKLGLRGIPTESESVMVARNVYLAQLTGAHIHCAHISTKDSVQILREAKKKGVPITAETCPHYFSLTEDAIQRYDTHAKMKPPLRSQADLEEVSKGLADGTIELIASDHAPHEHYSKEKEFSQAPFGIIGLETIFALVHDELVQKKVLSPIEAVRKMTDNPAKAFHLSGGHLSAGAPADLCLFDPNRSWTVSRFHSKSANSPFVGRRFTGKVVATVVGGNVIFQNDVFPKARVTAVT